MSDRVYPVSPDVNARAHIVNDKYLEMYKASIDEPATFWAEQANSFLTWNKTWTKVYTADFYKGEAAWFLGAELNASVNCIDRHLPERADQVAIIWEGDDPLEDKKITYQELYEQVCRLANLLKSRGVR